MYVYMVVCISWLTRACVCRCDGNGICIDHDLSWCSGWWYVSSVHVKYC